MQIITKFSLKLMVITRTMKKQKLVIMLFSLIVIGCSKEDKAKSLIKEELAKTMNDFKSYEPVEYGKLDSNITSYEKDFSKSDSINEIERVSFKPKFIGYGMIHSFRGKNAVGGTVLNRYWFYFDKNLTKVTKAIDDIKLEEERNKLIEEVDQELKESEVFLKEEEQRLK